LPFYNAPLLPHLHREIPSDKSLFLSIETTACAGLDTEVNYLEHVQAVITINATRRGDVELFLRSPMGTRYGQMHRTGTL
jgi:proprotein convertase subtilisin/kexin type 2